MSKYSEEELKVKAQIVLAASRPTHPKHTYYLKLIAVLSFVTGLPPQVVKEQIIQLKQ